MINYKQLIKKGAVIVGIAGLLASTMFLGGCSSDKTYTQEELNAKVAEAVVNVDITADNQLVADNAVEDYVSNMNPTEPIVFVPTSAQVTCEDYTADNLALGDVLDLSLDESDFCALEEGEVDVDDVTYDFESNLLFTNNVKVAYSGEKASYDEFGAEPRLVFDKTKSLEYVFTFEEMDWDAVDAENPIEFNFLGKDMKVVGIDDNKITVKNGKEAILKAGQVLDGIKIISVTDDEALVEYKLVPLVLEEGKTKRLVDGKRVSLTFADNDRQQVALVIGDYVSKTIKNNDPYFGFDEENDDWVWDISEADSTIGVKLNKRFDDSETALKVGDSIELPEGFARVTFEQVSVPKSENYEFSIDRIDVNDVPVDVFVVEGDLESKDGSVNEVAWDGNSFYVKEDGDWKLSEDISFGINGMELTGELGVMKFDEVELEVDFANDKLSKLSYSGMDLSEHAEDLLAQYGYVIESPEDGFEDGKLAINGMPKKQAEYKIVVSSIEA